MYHAIRKQYKKINNVIIFIGNNCYFFSQIFCVIRIVKNDPIARLQIHVCVLILLLPFQKNSDFRANYYHFYRNPRKDDASQFSIISTINCTVQRRRCIAPQLSQLLLAAISCACVRVYIK